jgi:hypothetical protein
MSGRSGVPAIADTSILVDMAADMVADIAAEPDLQRAVRWIAAIRARSVLARAAAAADTALLELEYAAESAKYELLNRTESAMTAGFVAQLERIETLRDKLPPEVLDALRERAFAGFTAAVSRISRRSGQ